MKKKKNTRAQKRNLGLKNNLKCQQITFTSIICCLSVSEGMNHSIFVFVLQLSEITFNVYKLESGPGSKVLEKR